MATKRIRLNFPATAIKAIPAIFGTMKKPIAAGEVVSVKKEFFYNGEFWYLLADGTDVPSVFFVE